MAGVKGRSGGLRNPPGGRPTDGKKKLAVRVPVDIYDECNSAIEKTLMEYEKAARKQLDKPNETK